MELSWFSRIKLTLVIILGVLVFGIGAWPFVKPTDPVGAFTFTNISLNEMLVLAVCSLVVGFAAYFLAWPWGRQMAIIAVPAGLAAWALRSGEFFQILKADPSAATRQQTYNSLVPESLAWFGLIAVGYLGVFAAYKLMPSKAVALDSGQAKKHNPLNIAIAFVISVIIAVLFTSFIARDVSFADSKLTSVVGQPSIIQGCCAALVAMALAAFIAKRIFDVNYIWPAISTLVVCVLAMKQGANKETLEYMASTWPAAFFSKGLYGLLPIQIIPFGIIGAVLGYWLAIRWKFWWDNHA